MKYEHEVIRDLMPLCIDGIASEQSRKVVEAHIAECPACASEWEQMTSGIRTEETEPLPEGTANYTETAEKLRKQNRKKKIIICLGTVLNAITVVFAVILITNLCLGNRYSARRMTENFLKAEWESYTEEEICEKLNIPKKCSFSHLHIDILGEVNSPDGTQRIVIAKMGIPGTNQVGIWECDLERSSPLQLGMWTDRGGSWGFRPDTSGIQMMSGGGSFQNGQQSLFYHTFFTDDPAVRMLRVQISGAQKEIPLDEKGFGAVAANIAYRIEGSCAADDMNDFLELREGEAFDANGNLLYRIEPIESTTENGVTYTHYEWMPAR